MRFLLDDLFRAVGVYGDHRLDKRAPVVVVDASSGAELGQIARVEHRGGEIRLEVECNPGVLCDGSGECVL